jgi:hypothetical protein
VQRWIQGECLTVKADLNGAIRADFELSGRPREQAGEATHLAYQLERHELRHICGCAYPSDRYAE